jgi:hypothetical protein
MIPNSEGREKISGDRFGEDDVDALLQMLHDYTEALRNRADSLENLRFALLSFVTIATAALSMSPQIFEYLNVDAVGSDSTRSIGLGFLLLALVSFLLVSLTLFRRFLRTGAEVRRLALLLGTLVRRASQFRDRGRVSFAQEIGIDVRLTDAESLLAGVLRSQGMRERLPGNRNNAAVVAKKRTPRKRML